MREESANLFHCVGWFCHTRPMNITEATNATLATFNQDMLNGSMDGWGKAEVALYIIDLMTQNLGE